MTSVYGIIGSGTAPTKAVRAALDDLPKGSTFIVPAGPGFSNLEPVYDWILDTESVFTVVGKPVRILAEAAEWAVPSATPEDTVLENLINSEADKKALLVMWGDGSDSVILSAHSKGISILELSNGLTPITVEDSPEPQDEEDEDTEDTPATEAEDFSRLEMESMPAAAVKRQAVNKGLDIKGKTKLEIIDEIFNHIPALSDDIECFEEAPQDTASQRVSDAHSPVSVILVLNNGTSVTIHGDQATMNRILAVL